MKKNEAISAEIEKSLRECIDSLSKIHPGCDIELLIMNNLMKKHAESIRQSEVDYFKKRAISSLGTDHEIPFDDAERGFLRAALIDGKQGFKEFIESITVEAPICDDGSKMSNRGSEKKSIMTSMGLIEGVNRTLYRDDISKDHAYPLDDKINLQIIGDNRSRYTHVFSHNAAHLYAKLTEEEAVVTLKQLLCIDIEKASLATVAQAVATEYISTKQEPMEELPLMGQETIEALEDDQSCENDGEVVSLAQRLQELDARSDRDKVIQDALDGKLEGVECGAAFKSVVYATSDGTGVPGLRKELSANGKNGGGAKTFEAKIGSVFQQSFSEGCLPILSGGEIYRIPGTTKYTGTVNKIDQFAPQFTEFAKNYGVRSYADVVFISDGAHWIWNMQRKLCPNAVCIIDFFHATENLNKIVDMLRFHSADKREAFREECHHLLELGAIVQLELLIKSKANTSNAQSVDKRLAYFTENADKMRYGLFRAAGLFIGSGVIEAACKTIVGKRMKNAGMHWSKKNAEGVIALRCAIYSDEFDSFDSNLIPA